MQPGFAAKKAKNKAKKAARKLKKQNAKASKSDADMLDAPANVGGDSDTEIDYEFHGRKGHQEKVDLKRQLKVRVKELKTKRAKLTKLPTQKAAKKQLTENLKEVVSQIKGGDKGKGKGGKGKAKAAADDAGAASAEGAMMVE